MCGASLCRSSDTWVVCRKSASLPQGQQTQVLQPLSRPPSRYTDDASVGPSPEAFLPPLLFLDLRNAINTQPLLQASATPLAKQVHPAKTDSLDLWKVSDRLGLTLVVIFYTRACSQILVWCFTLDSMTDMRIAQSASILLAPVALVSEWKICLTIPSAHTLYEHCLRRMTDMTVFR